MRSDSEIKRDVEAELRWSPDIDETDIAAKVNSGVVALTGFVRNYGDRLEAESAVKRVAGVAGVANDIQVRLPGGTSKADPEIAREAVAVVKGLLPYDAEKIKVLIQAGQVTLEGELEWNYQRDRAERAVRSLRGVIGVSNLIQVKPRVSPTDIKHKIEDAFRRSAQVDAERISVVADGGVVILKGKVRSWAEREEAQRTAWSAPGATQVKNEIVVSV